MYISALLIPEDDIANGFTCIDFSTMNRHKNDMVIKRLSHLPFVFYSLFVNVHIKQCHIQFLRLWCPKLVYIAFYIKKKKSIPT